MTATDMLDIEALHATLDLDPSDQFIRRILADAYEDAGDEAMADGLRRMADEQLRPTNSSGRCNRFPEFTWGWDYYGDAPSRVSPEVWDAIERHEVLRSPVGAYPARRAAEEALCLALAKGSAS